MSFKGYYRWVIVALLGIVTVINYVDRSAISFAVRDISTDFGLSAGQIGMVLGAFGLGYFVSALFGGVAVDKVGSRLSFALIVLVWTLAIGWTGAAMGFMTLYAARVALGLAEGPSFPTMEVAVSRWLPPEELATALARSLVAVPVALAIGSPLVSHLIGAFGWRHMFFIMAAMGLLWLPLWWLLYRDSPKDSRFVTKAELKHISAKWETEKGYKKAPIRWKRLFSTPTLASNYWAYFVFGYFLFFFMNWLPEFLRRSYHLDLSQVGYFAILPWAVAALLMLWFGGWSDKILRRSGSFRKARSYQIAGTQALAALAIIPIVVVDNLYVAIASITIAVGASMAANAAYYAVVVDLVPRAAGTTMGIMTLCFAASGFLAPVITGYAVDITGDFRPAFWLLSALAISSVVGVLLFHRPDVDKQKLLPLQRAAVD